MTTKLKALVEQIKASGKTVDDKILALFQLSEMAWDEGAINTYLELGEEALALGKGHYPELRKEPADGTFPRFLTKERIGRFNFQLPDIDLDDESKK